MTSPDGSERTLSMGSPATVQKTNPRSDPPRPALERRRRKERARRIEAVLAALRARAPRRP